MARPLRLELSGGVYHVTSRGDGREDIYLSDSDREAWLEVFGQVCERFNWVCHAWCQMTNHYHILIETPEANLAQGMRQLNGVYTQRGNAGSSLNTVSLDVFCLRIPFSFRQRQWRQKNWMKKLRPVDRQCSIGAG